MSTTTYQMIEAAEEKLRCLKLSYLQRWGWKETCQTPGSFWLWRRDFAAEDANRKAWDEVRQAGQPGRPSPSIPYGVVTADTDLAIAMTCACLDEQGERED